MTSCIRSLVFVIAISLFVGVNASGQQVPPSVSLLPLAELTAPDGNSMGYSVAISGNTVVVGSPSTNDNTGAAYVFVKPPTGWVNMTPVAELTASDGAFGDLFGSSVAISGNTIIVGAPANPNNNDEQVGAAYIFVEPPGGWRNGSQTAKLADGAIADYFGISVAVSGQTAIVGAPANSPYNLSPGVAYVFVNPGTGWQTSPTAKLTEAAGLNYDNFGISLSMSGSTVAVGAPLNPFHETFVFVEPNGGWVNMTETAELTPSDHGSLFGTSVSVSANTVLVGAPWATINGNAQQGSAYIFVEPSGGWTNMTQTAELTLSNGAALDEFGSSVAISGAFAVVGEPTQSEAYAFREPKAGWKSTGNYYAVGTASNANGFGASVSVAESTGIVGAPQATVGNQNQGAAFVFGR
jgi:hypothetical protein